MRYQTPDHNGETRQERNERFGQPELDEYYPEIPDAYRYIWEWFWDINAARERSTAGTQPLKNAEIWAWSQLTQNDISPDEYQILREMDKTFITALDEELKIISERMSDDSRPRTTRRLR